MIEHCTDPVVRRFIKELKQTYNNADLNPAHHKLSKLLMAGPGSLSLRQPDNRLDVPRWMSRGDIVLVDLGTSSGDFKHLIGSFLIANAYTAALARRDPDGQGLKPFHLFVDEAHRFSPSLQTAMIAQTRKFNAGLTLAHQYLKQFRDDAVNAFGTVDTSIVFSVDSSDAEKMARGMQGQVDVKQITALQDFEAYARFGTQPLHIHTPRFDELPEGAGQYEQIRARSIEHWYAPRHLVEAQANRRISGKDVDARQPAVFDAPEPQEMLPDAPNWPN
jgi:hypothetical protein